MRWHQAGGPELARYAPAGVTCAVLGLLATEQLDLRDANPAVAR